MRDRLDSETLGLYWALLESGINLRQTRGVAGRLYDEVVSLTAELTAAREELRVAELERRRSATERDQLRDEIERELGKSFRATKRRYLRLRAGDVDDVLRDMAIEMVTPSRRRDSLLFTWLVKPTASSKGEEAKKG